MYRHITVSLLLIFLLKVTLAFWVTETTTAASVLIRQRKPKQGFVTNFDNQKHETVQKRKQRSAYRLPISNAMSHLLGYSGNSGIENSTHITRGDKTCRKISCTINHFVRSCDENGGNDTCVPCAAGTFLLDKTSSMQHNHECVTVPPCYPEATLSRYPNFCGEHRTFCKCDLTRNFCGHDPCNCKVGHCSSVSAPVLNINCGCDRLPTAAKTPSMPTPTKATSTQASVTFTTASLQKIVPPACIKKYRGLSGGSIAGICIGVFIAGICVGVGVSAGIYFNKRDRGSYTLAPATDGEENRAMQELGSRP
ncbi:uncharacterized protein LOC117323520 [Pecten maximus]|uniref:uncharacterized protein LOC117323520 n=1 Tax=Pecten maximus TaxID=6579 RepID=UPI001458AE86|nr:uncharacterized protein LOC117323520 [Pecten maximus]XP_033734677.1 uncharacterized protein LOC117323520 [Pecten maximus]